MSYIYIISNSLGHLKVGIAKDPKKRLKQLQTGSANKLELLFTEEFEIERAGLLKIERLIHRELCNKYKRISGEWFTIPLEDIEFVKSTIVYNRIRYDADPIALKYLVTF